MLGKLSIEGKLMSFTIVIIYNKINKQDRDQAIDLLIFLEEW